jgi:adenylate kinase family enzyme
MIIAIDGPAASGKGTLGKRLALHYGYRHLDTGVIYRAVAKMLLDQGFELTDEARAVAAAMALDRNGSVMPLRWCRRFPACARRWSAFSASSRLSRRAPYSTGAISER